MNTEPRDKAIRDLFYNFTLTSFLFVLLVVILSGCTTQTGNTTVSPVTTIANTTEPVNVTTNQTNVTEALPSFLSPAPGLFAVYNFYFDQGTSWLITTPDNKTILIDVTKDNVQAISRYLKDLGFYKIDYLLLTNARQTGAERAILKYSPKAVYHNGMGLPFRNYSIDQVLIPTDEDIELYENQTFSLHAFVPYDDGQGFIGQDDILFQFKYKTASFLIGNCQGECEDRLGNANLISDVFYLPDGCGTSLFMLEAIQPSQVIYRQQICDKELSALNSISASLVNSNLATEVSTNGLDYNFVRYDLR